VERIVQEVLRSVSGFNVKIRMWKNAEKFDMAFETDLDNIITDRTKKVVGAEIAKIQNEIRNKVNAKITEKRAEAEKLFNEKKVEVQKRIAEYQTQLNDKVAMAEAKKKEVEKRIEEEKNKKTDDLKKKAEGALKGIFKR
ncbi:MAG: hypothetical protein HY966_07050, partial [Ignavibacteriales bacterium]|nr:hypothetical protein [Ignavibacteriales bacterium]